LRTGFLHEDLYRWIAQEGFLDGLLLSCTGSSLLIGQRFADLIDELDLKFQGAAEILRQNAR
jgi:hypothetical protein